MWHRELIGLKSFFILDSMSASTLSWSEGFVRSRWKWYRHEDEQCLYWVLVGFVILSVDLWQTQVCIRYWEFPGGPLKLMSSWRMGKKSERLWITMYNECPPAFGSAVFQPQKVRPQWMHMIWLTKWQMLWDCLTYMQLSRVKVCRFLSVYVEPN